MDYFLHTLHIGLVPYKQYLQGTSMPYPAPRLTTAPVSSTVPLLHVLDTKIDRKGLIVLQEHGRQLKCF